MAFLPHVNTIFLTLSLDLKCQLTLGCMHFQPLYETINFICLLSTVSPYTE